MESNSVKNSESSGYETGVDQQKERILSWADDLQPRGTYQHKPLNDSDSEVRLLRVEIDQAGTASANIEVFSLTTMPIYSCLSYAWGNGDARNRICLDGRSFFIRDNLYKFFAKYSWSPAEYFWIDQICIDQSNVEERNHQVPLMHTLYSQAQKVVIWLNAKHVGRYWACNDCKTSGRWCHCPATSASNMDRFIYNTYWERIWVIQEIALAKRLECHIGSVGCLTFTEKQMQALLYPATKEENKNPDGFPLNFITSRMILRLENEVPLEFALAIVRFCYSTCSNLRDKVYGLQALLHPDQKVKRIDYSLPLVDVFLDGAEVLQRCDFTAAEGYSQYKTAVKLLAHSMFGERLQLGQATRLHNIIDAYSTLRRRTTEDDISSFQRDVREAYAAFAEMGDLEQDFRDSSANDRMMSAFGLPTVFIRREEGSDAPIAKSNEEKA